MSDLEMLYGLLKKAYDDGFRKGNGMDSGCRPDDHGDFQGFWNTLGAGDMATAIASLLSVGEQGRVSCQPGSVVPFKEGDFVVSIVEHSHGTTVASLQDRKTYEDRVRMANDLWGPP